MLRRRTFNWRGAIFLCLTPPIAIALTLYHLKNDGFMWPIWIFGVIMYALTAMSITAGYHRCFAHRAFQARPWVKWFWAIFGAAAFQNSILIWARDHRIHHRYVDTDIDPYTISRGFFFAHFGWMMMNEEPGVNIDSYERDLKQDPVVAFQHKHYELMATVFGFGLPTLVGHFLGSAFGGLAVAGFLRMVALHHGTFFINSWCHYFGRQTYTDTNSARDSLIMAIATFGEGYHNFHHIFAQDYRNGIRWYHWDPTKWSIQVLNLIGGVHSLRKTPWSAILKAQMKMEQRRLKSKLHARFDHNLQTQLEGLSHRLEMAVKKWEQIREDYRQLACNCSQAPLDRLAEIKMQMRLARIEFKAARDQWRAFKSFVGRSLPSSS
jgi:stearoyl-CoA desaturase (delta-9 desaturase)